MESQKKNLQNVVDICFDGVQGYEKAAAELEHTEFKTIFNRLAQQRKLFIEELKIDARDLGLELSDSGTVKGFFHRTWLQLKASLSGRTDEQIMEEAKRGEQEAVAVYDEAINAAEMPEYLREKLKKQKHFIAGSIAQLTEFEKEIV